MQASHLKEADVSRSSTAIFPYSLELSTFFYICRVLGDCGGTVVKVLCYKSEGRWFDPSWCRWIFIDIKFFQSHYGPGVDSASNRNEYQEYFLGVKSGRCVRLTTYHHPVPLSRNLRTLTSWNPLGLSRLYLPGAGTVLSN